MSRVKYSAGTTASPGRPDYSPLARIPATGAIKREPAAKTLRQEASRQPGHPRFANDAAVQDLAFLASDRGGGFRHEGGEVPLPEDPPYPGANPYAVERWRCRC